MNKHYHTKRVIVSTFIDEYMKSERHISSEEDKKWKRQMAKMLLDDDFFQNTIEKTSFLWEHPLWLERLSR